MDKWLLSIALGKASKRVISFAVSALLSGLASSNLDKIGVNVNVDQNVLTGSMFAGIEILKNYLKHKVGLKWL